MCDRWFDALQALHLWLQAMGMKHALPASAVPTMVRA
jgi:hypothetical protein